MGREYSKSNAIFSVLLSSASKNAKIKGFKIAGFTVSEHKWQQCLEIKIDNRNWQKIIDSKCCLCIQSTET